MPSPQTQTVAQAILARETGEVFADCLKIEGEGLGPYLFTPNTEALEREGGSYRPMSFHALPPDDTDQVNPTMSVQIDNVDREMVRLVKEYDGIPTTTFETVLASSPDTVVHGPFEFSVRGCEADQLLVTLQCGHEEDFLNQGIPAQHYDPTNSPGLYV